jgi:two-component system, cell cycle sensor histidine kinase and response regulator CckA
MMPANILIVEDEGLVAEEIALRVQQMGHHVAAIVDNAADAFDFVTAVRPDMALLDINLRGATSGIEIARRFRHEFDVPAVFLTAHADTKTLKEATETEPFGYVVKPFDQRMLAATLETALRRRRAEQKLAKMEHWLSATMTSIGDGVIATDKEYHVSFINPVAERLCGWPNGSALGRPVTEVYRIQGAACSALSDMIDEAIRDSVAINLDQCELQSADGSAVPIDDTLSPIRDERGQVGGIVIVFRDARERKRHEQELLRLNSELDEQVQRRTAQLQAANSELASFSYSIAHDLRAPLRAVNAFASLLVQEHGKALDAEGQRLLDIVIRSASRMARMIDDYLKLSGLSHVELARKTIDMSALAREAWATVTVGVERAPQLELGELPQADGDESLIRQVWINLLTNAVKFTRSVENPRVRVSGSVDEQTARYSIEDNGVGFDPAYAPKLFQVFERLHTQQEFEGNGVGLCIVQRILHRHEGDISLEGRLGSGVRVNFWLRRSSLALDERDAFAHRLGIAAHQRMAPGGEDEGSAVRHAVRDVSSSSGRAESVICRTDRQDRAGDLLHGVRLAHGSRMNVELHSLVPRAHGQQVIQQLADAGLFGGIGRAHNRGSRAQHRLAHRAGHDRSEAQCCPREEIGADHGSNEGSAVNCCAFGQVVGRNDQHQRPAPLRMADGKL